MVTQLIMLAWKIWRAYLEYAKVKYSSTWKEQISKKSTWTLGMLICLKWATFQIFLSKTTIICLICTNRSWPSCFSLFSKTMTKTWKLRYTMKKKSKWWILQKLLILNETQSYLSFFCVWTVTYSKLKCLKSRIETV